jgi:hypothetical protein
VGGLQSVRVMVAGARNAKTRAVTVDTTTMNNDIPLFQLQ